MVKTHHLFPSNLSFPALPLSWRRALPFIKTRHWTSSSVSPPIFPTSHASHFTLLMSQSLPQLLCCTSARQPPVACLPHWSSHQAIVIFVSSGFLEFVPLLFIFVSTSTTLVQAVTVSHLVACSSLVTDPSAFVLMPCDPFFAWHPVMFSACSSGHVILCSNI